MIIKFDTYASEDKNDVLEMMSSFNSIDGYSFNSLTREHNLVEFTSNPNLGRLFLIKK